MRRPLFGTGTPKRALFDDGLITVFDTTKYTPNAGAPQALAVTLFAWGWQNLTPTQALDQSKLPDLVVTLKTDGGPATPPAVSQVLSTDFVAFEAASSLVAKPIVLVDRLVLRGNQQLLLANLNGNCSVANKMSCYVYGYFETVGEARYATPFRPLQPGNLVAPFSAAPTSLTLAAGAAAAYVTAHQLTTAYLDEITVEANVGTIGAPDTATTAFLRLPGGVKLPLPINATNLLQRSEPFCGVPLIAPSASDNLVEIGFDAPSAGQASYALAWGRFNR